MAVPQNPNLYLEDVEKTEGENEIPHKLGVPEELTYKAANRRRR